MDLYYGYQSPILWLRFSKSLQRNGYYFINGYTLFYSGRNSLESLQAYDPALGGYIIQVEITSNMQVPCHCQHAPWHLGANAKSFFAQLIEDPTHHIVDEPALGGYQLLLSKIQGTQALIHYIERSIIQLVEYKALNLVDVGSSPMVEITSYTVIINESYTKSQLGNILLTRPLGATCCWSRLHDHIYKLPAHYCIMTRPLGATPVEVFMGIR